MASSNEKPATRKAPDSYTKATLLSKAMTARNVPELSNKDPRITERAIPHHEVADRALKSASNYNFGRICRLAMNCGAERFKFGSMEQALLPPLKMA